MNYDYPWLRAISRYDWDYLKRTIRRYPRRKTATSLAVFVLFIYLCTRNGSQSNLTSAQKCLHAKILQWNANFERGDFGANKSAVHFVGNGHFSVDKDYQLRFGKIDSSIQNLPSGFVPVVVSRPEVTYDSAGETFTDFNDGILHEVNCYSVENDCVCVKNSLYAHRTREDVFVQELEVNNPTKNSVRLTSGRAKPSSDWVVDNRDDATVFTKKFIGEKKVASVMCTEASDTITISQRREETIRFTCVIKSSNTQEGISDDVALQSLRKKTVDVFSQLPDSKVVDKEHREGWQKVHRPYYGIGKSLAPDILNGDRINATKYIILSNTIFINDDLPSFQISLKNAQNTDHCYTGHSTLLYPSRLWDSWDTTESLLHLADTWKITLEKRGCEDTIKLGAYGVSQAFVQSLAACSFHDSHLEIGLDASDLHRSVTFGGVPIYGAVSIVGYVNVAINIDNDNRPYFLVSSTAELYACEAGCLTDPVLLGKNPTRIPIKVTKPVTSLLYVATNRRHLQLLRSAIHVAEVDVAPAHEQEILDLHKSGGSGGLPTHFWVFLIAVLIIFHLFLAKLLWNEWRKDDMTPYNPYLKSRYSSLRSH